MTNKKNVALVIGFIAFIFSCGKDEQSAKTNSTDDQEKAISFISQMNSFDNYSGMGPSSKMMSNGKVAGDPPAICNVLPKLIETTDSYSTYEYDFDDPTQPCDDFDGKMRVTFGSGTEIFAETIFINYKDNTLRNSNGTIINNEINGNSRIDIESDGSTRYNSHMEVAVEGQPDIITECKDLTVSTTSDTRELNGIMNLTLNQDQYKYEYISIKEQIATCQYAISGTLKVTSIAKPSETLEVDFGNGTCDDKVTLRYDGKIEDITINQ